MCLIRYVTVTYFIGFGRILNFCIIPQIPIRYNTLILCIFTCGLISDFTPKPQEIPDRCQSEGRVK